MGCYHNVDVAKAGEEETAPADDLNTEVETATEVQAPVAVTETAEF